MEQPQIQRGVTAHLFIPFATVAQTPATNPLTKTYAIKDGQAEPEPVETKPLMYRALAITEGKFNGTVFTAEELSAMVDRINESGRVNQIRIVEEHNDSVGALLGRATSLNIETVNVDGEDLQGATINFALFDRLQKQRDAITQLEQAPDLIGLSVAVCGDLIPVEVYQNEEIVDIDWTWKGLDLIHVALVTYPACSATEGSIAAVYKTADGRDFNPSFFSRAPTSSVMETTPDTVATSVSTTSPANIETPKAQFSMSADDAKAVFADIAKVGTLSAKIGIEPNANLIVSLSADQRKAYITELEQIAEKFAAATAPKSSSDEPAPEKGTEFGAATPDAATIMALGRQFLDGTGPFAGGNNQ